MYGLYYDLECDISPCLKGRGFPLSRMGDSCFNGSCPFGLSPNGSYTPSTGSNREPLGQNVERSVDITVVYNVACWTDPFTSVRWKRVKHMLAGMTGFRRGIPLINLDQGS